MEWLAIVEHEQAPLILAICGLGVVWGTLRKQLNERIAALVSALNECERKHSRSRADNRVLAQAILDIARGNVVSAREKAGGVWARQIGDANDPEPD